MTTGWPATSSRSDSPPHRTPRSRPFTTDRTERASPSGTCKTWWRVTCPRFLSTSQPKDPGVPGEAPSFAGEGALRPPGLVGGGAPRRGNHRVRVRVQRTRRRDQRRGSPASMVRECGEAARPRAMGTPDDTGGPRDRPGEVSDADCDRSDVRRKNARSEAGPGEGHHHVVARVTGNDPQAVQRHHRRGQARALGQRGPSHPRSIGGQGGGSDEPLAANWGRTGGFRSGPSWDQGRSGPPGQGHPAQQPNRRLPRSGASGQPWRTWPARPARHDLELG